MIRLLARLGGFTAGLLLVRLLERVAFVVDERQQLAADLWAERPAA